MLLKFFQVKLLFIYIKKLPITVRTYKRKLGARNYKSYSDEELTNAIAEVRTGTLTQLLLPARTKLTGLPISTRTIAT